MLPPLVRISTCNFWLFRVINCDSPFSWVAITPKVFTKAESAAGVDWALASAAEALAGAGALFVASTFAKLSCWRWKAACCSGVGAVYQ